MDLASIKNLIQLETPKTKWCVCVYLFIYLFIIYNQENSIKTHLENIEEYSYIKMDVKVICVQFMLSVEMTACTKHDSLEKHERERVRDLIVLKCSQRAQCLLLVVDCILDQV